MYWMLSFAGDGSCEVLFLLDAAAAADAAAASADSFAAAAPPFPPFIRRILGPFFGRPVAGSMGFAFVVDAFGGSGSWTVRMCFARASERVKERSHSKGVVCQRFLCFLFVEDASLPGRWQKKGFSLVWLLMCAFSAYPLGCAVPFLAHSPHSHVYLARLGAI